MNVIRKLLPLLFCLVFPATPVLAGEVSLSAAASLREVINELSGSFTKKHPGVKILKNFGASGALAMQIENGAPADIFLSANGEWMDYLQKKKLLEEASVGTFAYNALVFVGTTRAGAAGMWDLPRLGRIVIGSPKSVPAGEYAMTALKNAGVDRHLAKKLVMARDVRECLAYAEQGEVDGAFVYRTDAIQAKRARILFAVPQELYPRVTYPMGLTVGGARKSDAQAFYRYLQSGEARTVLVKYGFAVK